MCAASLRQALVSVSVIEKEVGLPVVGVAVPVKSRYIEVPLTAALPVLNDHWLLELSKQVVGLRVPVVPVAVNVSEQLPPNTDGR